MAIAQSRLTAQGQISIPAEVRKKLGVGPGSILEWDEQNDEVAQMRAAEEFIASEPWSGARLH